MKKLILMFCILLAGSCFAQTNSNWSNVMYKYYTGPVSPEFQYNYEVQINKDGSGSLAYTKAGNTATYDFNIGRRGKKKLNRTLKGSKVFQVPESSLQSDSKLMGGPERNAVITMWQSPDLDQKPQMINVPGNVTQEYQQGVYDLFDVIENLVPDSVWDKVTR
ncbi:MAG: hypothetical protein SGI89_06365 [bacterium]|nr:hypothetical protein [bacterium]